MSYSYEYPRPSVTVDCTIFALKNGEYQILLIQRGKYPFEGMWALPGGFLDMDEELIDAAKRELKEETGLIVENIQQLHTFGKLNRDPRGRTISVVFWGTTNYTDNIAGADDAIKAQWFSIKDLPKLAFDHDEIVKLATLKLSDK